MHSEPGTLARCSLPVGPAQIDARYTLWRYAATHLLVALRASFPGGDVLGVRAGVSDHLEADRTRDEFTGRRFEAADCDRPGAGDVRCVLDSGKRAVGQAPASLLAVLGGPADDHRG